MLGTGENRTLSRQLYDGKGQVNAVKYRRESLRHKENEYLTIYLQADILYT